MKILYFEIYKVDIYKSLSMTLNIVVVFQHIYVTILRPDSPIPLVMAPRWSSSTNNIRMKVLVYISMYTCMKVSLCYISEGEYAWIPLILVIFLQNWVYSNIFSNLNLCDYLWTYITSFFFPIAFDVFYLLLPGQTWKQMKWNRKAPGSELHSSLLLAVDPLKTLWPHSRFSPVLGMFSMRLRSINLTLSMASSNLGFMPFSINPKCA